MQHLAAKELKTYFSAGGDQNRGESISDVCLSDLRKCIQMSDTVHLSLLDELTRNCLLTCALKLLSKLIMCQMLFSLDKSNELKLIYFWWISGSQCKHVSLQADLRKRTSSSANAVWWCPLQRKRPRGNSYHSHQQSQRRQLPVGRFILAVFHYIIYIQEKFQAVCVCFVQPGWGPAAADAEDGELGPQAVSQTAVWRVYWPSGEARQEEGSAGGTQMSISLIFCTAGYVIIRLVFFCSADLSETDTPGHATDTWGLHR